MNSPTLRTRRSGSRRLRDDARAVARFVPDCAVLVARLVRDQRVARRHKVLLFLLAGYLSLPFDLVPDFIPVAGQLDDALVVAVALRSILHRTPRALVAEHWPGSPGSLDVLLRATGEARRDSAGAP